MHKLLNPQEQTNVTSGDGSYISRLTGALNATANSIIDNERSKEKYDAYPYAKNASHYQQQFIYHHYNVYPEDHPLHERVNELFWRINNSQWLPPVRIYDQSARDINAFVFQNGQIFVSRALLDFCEYEEEVLAILGHEIRHHQEGHHEKKSEKKQNGGLLNKILHQTGMSLLHEWQADIWGLIDLDNSWINPYGAAIFFKKLSDLQKKQTRDDFSSSHGSTMDRFLNTHASTRLYDFNNMSEKELVPFSCREYGRYQSHEEWRGARMEMILGEYTVGNRSEADKILEESKKVTHIQALAAIPKIRQNITHLYARMDNLWVQFLKEDAQVVLKNMVNSIEDFVFSDDDFMPDEQAFIFWCILDFSWEVRLWSQFLPAESIFSDITEDTSETLQDPDRVLRNLSALVTFFRKHSIFITCSPLAFTGWCMRTMSQSDALGLERGEFGNFKVWMDGYLASLEWLYRQSAIDGELFNREENLQMAWEILVSKLQSSGQFTQWFKNEYAIDLSNHVFELSLWKKKPVGFGKITEWEKNKNPSERKGKDSLLSLMEILQSWDLHGLIPRLSDFIGKQRFVDDATISFAVELKKKIVEIDPTDEEGWRHSFLEGVAKYVAQRIGDRDIVTQAKIIQSLAYDDGDILIITEDTEFQTIWFDLLSKKYSSYEEIRIVYKELFKHTSMDAIDFRYYPSVHFHFEFAVYFQAIKTLKERSLTEALEILRSWEHNGILQYRSINWLLSEDACCEENAYSEAVRISHFFLATFMDAIDSCPEKDRPMILWEISRFFPDGIYQESVQKSLIKPILKDVEFDDGFPVFVEWSVVPLEVTEAFIDTKARTHEQIERSKKAVLKKLQFEWKEEDLAQYHILHLFLENRDKLTILKLALGTGENDTELKRYIVANLQKLPNIEDIQKIDVDMECEKLYLMSDTQKMIFLRKLLLGKKGILEDSSAKRELLDTFAEKHLENPGGDVEQNILHIFRMLLDEGSIEEVYFIFSSILHDKLFQRPQDWENAQKSTSKKSGKGNFSDIYLRAEKLCGWFDRTESREKMDAAWLIIQIARHLWSIGIRFLQIMGQYIDIPPHLQWSFDEIYDSITGQSKLVAHTSLIRDWAQMEDNISEIGKPIGGWSIVTVYEAKNHQGKDVVLKVMNPSFRFQYEKMFQTLINTFSRLAEKEPKYAIAIPIIQDIKKWIESDVEFEGFLKKDAKFHKKWNGWKADKKDRYSIKIPRSYAPESRKFKIEEFVPGENLTQIEMLEKNGHDIQSIIGLLIAHYIEQIKEGQIHSDMHPGNFRVTSDNQVAILDRNFYLTIGLKEKLFIRQLMQNKEDHKTLLEWIGSYLGWLDENSGQDIVKMLMKEPIDINNANPIASVFQILNILRKEHIYIPLWMTLFVKNINALYDLAKKTGVEALI